MLDNLEKYKLILASHSPRRKELLSGLGLTFEIRIIPDIDESYPVTLSPKEIPLYVAQKKANAYLPALGPDELLITADTVVHLQDRILGKPRDREDAIRMLRALSGNKHEVITGVCLITREKQRMFSVISEVCFASLAMEDIFYYTDHFHPYDKAGAYGIQEWIGYVGVESIKGSFYNVMGLPIQRVYQELRAF